MGRKKIIGTCKIEGCQRELDSLGFCTLHYHRFRKHGTPEKVNRLGKSKHPNNQTWWDRHSVLPPEWLDFWQFVKDVGEKPSKNHFLVKIDRTKPYSATNFMWLEHIKRQPHETDKEWFARKWKRRVEINPDINRNRGIFYEFGMSPTEYKEKLEILTKEQNDHCAICDNPETAIEKKLNRPRRLALDHCHKTMKIRGLLCSRCNRALGAMEDNPIFVKSMLRYRKKYLENPSSQTYNKRNALFRPCSDSECCEICKNPETKVHKSGTPFKLSMDHCHTTGKIRGLLCSRCNTTFGRMEESEKYLKAMLKYIKKHS